VWRTYLTFPRAPVVVLIPPLSRATAWIEVHAAGRSAQARATLPLRWE
jgi:hypothetical protein